MSLFKQVNQVKSLQDIMDPTFPKHIYKYLMKGKKLSTEWSSPLLQTYAGFKPITFYSQGAKVVGTVTTTVDGQSVVMYGWDSPWGQKEVQKQLKGLYTSTMDNTPAPVGVPTVLVRSFHIGQDEPNRRKNIHKDWQFV